jgi:hypothetical protein
MHDGGSEHGRHHRAEAAPRSGDRRRPNANYRYFGTILFVGALAMILLMVLLHR